MKKPIKPSGMETSKLAIVVFVVLIPIMRLLFVKSGVSFSEIMGNLVDTSENEAIWLVAIIVSGALAMSIGTIKHYIAMERYKAEVEKLATIPSKEVLIAKLLGSFKAPLSNLAYLLNAIAEKKQETAAE